jgi:hypothetical protein
VVAFAPAEPGSDSLRGSARSIPGLHIRDALAAVAAAHPGLLGKFGGHAMAAGLTLPAAHYEAFVAAFRSTVAAMVTPDLLRAELLSDGALEPDEFDRRHADALRDGGPWGQAFPEPLFDGEFEVADWKVVGERRLARRPSHPAGRRTPRTRLTATTAASATVGPSRSAAGWRQRAPFRPAAPPLRPGQAQGRGGAGFRATSVRTGAAMAGCDG